MFVACGAKSRAAGRNIKLVLEYDGTDFSGWQRQAGRHRAGCRTVQQTLEEAILAVTGETVSVIASGRTDAGVHAEGQVAAFRTETLLPPARLAAAINANLPEDVAVLSAEDAPGSFHPIRDARGKLYRYRISRRGVRPVLMRRFTWRVRGRLDLGRMKRAAAYLVGTHDFNSFRNEGRVPKNTVRTIESIDFVESDDMIEIFFRGSGFLYMMVRIIVGTLVEAGRGRIEPEVILCILDARAREAAGATAPPEGLCLVEVYY